MFQPDPSAAAGRQIRRRNFVRRKFAGKISARRVSRRILLAVNLPQNASAAEFLTFSVALYPHDLICFTYFV